MKFYKQHTDEQQQQQYNQHNYSRTEYGRNGSSSLAFKPSELRESRAPPGESGNKDPAMKSQDERHMEQPRTPNKKQRKYYRSSQAIVRRTTNRKTKRAEGRIIKRKLRKGCHRLATENTSLTHRLDNSPTNPLLHQYTPNKKIDYTT